MITYSGSWWKVGLFLIVVCVLRPGLAGADSEMNAYQVQAYRTSQTIEIDGELDESDWSKAIPISQLVQVEPNEGEPTTQPTEVRILYDDKNIYFGFTCSDSDMPRLTANEMRRDGRDIHDNDNVYVLLDTYNDRRSGFFFRVNALGAMQDSAVTSSGASMNRDWNAVWKCDARIHEDHWTAEFAIPFSQLRFNQSDELVWGINLGREIPRSKEDAIWVPVSKAYGGMAKYRTSDLGKLVGLEGVSPGRHLELLPYILPGVSYGDKESDEDEDEVNTELDVGLDVKYGITSNLTADITINTDFAQVEADQEQVNLTRFSLFFPEKRPFFLEGAGLFDFGIPRASFRRPPPMLLFYSRRIGLEEGSAIPIIAGGKITGKVGPYGIGVLNVLTDDAQVISEEDEETIIDVPVTNHSVLRLKRDVLSRSSVGLIAVNKQTEDTYNRAGGLDFTYCPMDTLDFQGMWSRSFEQETSEEETSGDHEAWSLGGNWRNDFLRLQGSYMDIDENFNPGMGYLQREGIRRIHGEMRYAPWPKRFGIRQIYTGPEIDYILDQDNELATREFSYLNWFELERGGSFVLSFQRTFDRLDEDFEIRDGIIIPLGDYSFNSYTTFMRTDGNRDVSGELRLSLGDFYGGDRLGLGAEANFKPSGRFGVEARYEFNKVTLPVGSFNDHLLGTRVVYAHSTSLYAKLFTQLSSEGDVINVNFLLNWIYRPGSDFYLVFNQIYDISDDKTDLAESTFIIKMTYWWNP
ncbi:DUF5916 domain-containing protein [Candidatus Poribacteria bacterium]